MPNYTMSDVIWAIETIDKFTQFKSKFNKLLKNLASKGIDISQVDLNNPMSLLPILLEARMKGIDVSLNDIKKIIAEFNDISFADVEKAVHILNSYYALVNTVEYNLRRVVAEGKMSTMELGMLAQLFGLKLPHFTPAETEVESEDEELPDYEDLTELRQFLKRIKNQNE